MAIKKAALGRGLDALLADVKLQDWMQPPTSEQPTSLALRQLAIDDLQPSPYQPRRDFNDDSIQELAESIRVQGVLQPLLVRQIAPKRFEIVAGERRFRAAQLAGLTQIPVLVRDLNTEDAVAIALIENLQREDLNPMDTALGLQRLANEYKLTHQEIATAVGKSRSTVTNLLRLLELTPEVKNLLEQGQIEMGHARTLISLSATHQIKLAQIIINKQLSVRQTERLAQHQYRKTSRPLVSTPETDPNIRHLQNNLAEHLGAVVEIKQRSHGRGHLVIKYHSYDELSGILERILGELSFP